MRIKIVADVGNGLMLPTNYNYLLAGIIHAQNPSSRISSTVPKGERPCFPIVYMNASRDIPARRAERVVFIFIPTTKLDTTRD